MFVEDDVGILVTEFGNLVAFTRKSLEIAEVKPYSLVTHLLGLPIYQTHTAKECFLSEVRPKLEEAKTLSAIFQILSRFWSFIDFELLQNVIVTFQLDNKEMNTYLEKHRKFGETWIGKPTQLTDTDMTNRARLSIDVDVETPNWLNRYTEFKKKICEVFNLRVFSLRLFAVTKGCVRFVFLFPESFHATVLSLSPQQTEQLLKIVPSVRRITTEDRNSQSYEVFRREVSTNFIIVLIITNVLLTLHITFMR